MEHAPSNVIRRGSRILHRLYGRGLVEAVYSADQQARVQIDGEVCWRRLRLRDLVLEPVGMPKARTELHVVHP